MRCVFIFFSIILFSSCGQQIQSSNVSISTISEFTTSNYNTSRFRAFKNGFCSGQNDFPGIKINSNGLDIKSLVLIAEDTIENNFVLLFMYNIPVQLKQIPLIKSVAGITYLESFGSVASNYYGDRGWTGPCNTEVHKIRFKIYGMKKPVYNFPTSTDTKNFDVSYKEEILSSSEIFINI